MGKLGDCYEHKNPRVINGINVNLVAVCVCLSETERLKDGKTERLNDRKTERLKV